MAVKFQPDGYHSATPYLIVHDAAAALAFYARAFNAVELFRMDDNGRIGHAEFKIGDSALMIADEHPEMGYRSARTLGGSPVGIMLYVENVDAIVQQAVDAGAKLTRPVQNQFYGDRAGGVEDPFGHHWYISTHFEDVPPEELEIRAAASKSA